MSNKYLEKIAGILPNFKQFGGFKQTISEATSNPELAGKFSSKFSKARLVEAAKSSRSTARKELGKAVGLTGAGVVGAGVAASKLKGSKND